MLQLPPVNEKTVEIAFAAVFSALIMVVFYAVISMNGLVLGNDPAVHLEKAQIFLKTGKIPLDNLGWTPPLFHLLLAALISLTGAGSLEQLIFLEKTLAVLVDWLLFFSVYLIGTKFFGKKVGGIAAVLLLFCFPMFEMNLWGGYTSVLGLAFMFLLFLYLPLAVKDFGHIIVAFLVAFSLVLSHQLAMFLTVLILPPILLYMLMKFRGRQLKALIAVLLGGGIAFFLYYFQAMIPYLGVLVEHVFFMQKTTLYQIPATTLNAFMVNFGFIFVIAIAGIFTAFFELRTRKEPLLFITLFASFIVPLVLAESHLFGLYLPFHWFVYYLMPGMVLLAGFLLDFALNQFSMFYLRNRRRWGKLRLRAVAVSLVIMVSLLFLVRFGTVYGKIMEASVYYSTSDLKAYDAGVWLKTNFPDEATVVVTEVPGFWFRLFSGKTVIAATDPVVERNKISESVLDLSYELDNPVTMIRTYESKGNVSDENYVSINDVWNRVSISAADGDFISYSQNGVEKKPMTLATFNREIVFDDGSIPKKFMISYSNEDITVTKTVVMQNDSYPISISWSLSPNESEIGNVVLNITTFFDLHFSFKSADVPGILHWENPWDRPSDFQGTDWAVVSFTPSTLTDNYLGFYDEDKEVALAVKFEQLPDWGNVGALGSRQIDAMRFRYNFGVISVGQTASFGYKILSFSKSSYLAMQQLSDMKNLLEVKSATTFVIDSRNYRDYIEENDVKFIVYDKNQLDTKIINCRLLELVYSNDRYVIFRIKVD